MSETQWHDSEQRVIREHLELTETKTVTEVARDIATKHKLKRTETAIRHRLRTELKRKREIPLRLLAEAASREEHLSEFKEAIIAQAVIQQQVMDLGKRLGTLTRLALAEDARIEALENGQAVKDVYV